MAEAIELPVTVVAECDPVTLKVRKVVGKVYQPSTGALVDTVTLAVATAPAPAQEACCEESGIEEACCPEGRGK